MDLHTINGKLQISSGDVEIATKKQHDQEIAQRILRNPKGTFLLKPELGLGLEREINGPLNLATIENDVTVNLEADQFRVDGVSIDPETGEIDIQAERKQ